MVQWTSFTRRIVQSLCAWGLLLLLGITVASAEEGTSSTDDPEWIKVRQLLRDWRSRFANLTLKWRSMSSDAPSISQQHSWTWTDQQQVRHERLVYNQGKMDRRELSITANQRRLVCKYPTGESDPAKPSAVENWSVKSEEPPPDPLWGLFSARGNSWVFEPDITITPDPARDLSFVGSQQLVTRECPHSDTHGDLIAFATEPPILWKTAANYVNSRANYSTILAIVDEVREVEPGVSIPWKGRFEIAVPGEVQVLKNWEMTEAIINQNLSRETFLPPGRTEVDLYDILWDERVKAEAKEKEEARHRRAAGDFSTPLRRVPGIPAEAPPPAWDHWLWPAGVLCVTGLIWFLVRRSVR